MTEHKTWCPAHRYPLNSETDVSNAGKATGHGTYVMSERNAALGRAGKPKLVARSAQCGCGATGQYARLRRAVEKARRRAEAAS